MHLLGTDLVLSATDLSNFLGCRHRTELDMAMTYGARARPRANDDPLLELLWQRGRDHEQRYVESLRAEGRSVVELPLLGTPEEIRENARGNAQGHAHHRPRESA